MRNGHPSRFAFGDAERAAKAVHLEWMDCPRVDDVRIGIATSVQNAVSSSDRKYSIGKNDSRALGGNLVTVVGLR